MQDSDLAQFQTINSGIIDSHAHLLKEFYEEGTSSVIKRMEEANVRQIINPGVNLQNIPELINLAENHKNIFIGLGLHPHEAVDWNNESKELLEGHIKHPKVVAVGECGLDFFYNNSPAEKQVFAFKEQLKIARKFNKPIIIHCRDAWPQLWEILKAEGHGIRGVLHCFTGNEAIIRQFKELKEICDFYISFSGIVTFAKSTEIQGAAKIVDNDRLLVETDCPFLAPHPVRGKRNEPAYVWYVVKKLAELRKQPLAEVAELCTNNAKQLFSLPN